MRTMLEAEYEAHCHGDALDKEFPVPDGWGNSGPDKDWLGYWRDLVNDAGYLNPKGADEQVAAWNESAAEVLAQHALVQSALSKLSAAELKALQLKKDGSYVKDILE